jgi:hypothetical protein
MSRKKKLRTKKQVIDMTCRWTVAYVRRPISNRRRVALRRQLEQLQKWTKKNNIGMLEEHADADELSRSSRKQIKTQKLP